MDMDNQTITLTFGDTNENHKGMVKRGKTAKKGFNKKNLDEIQKKFEKKGCVCEMYHLNNLYGARRIAANKVPEPAYLLVIRDGVRCMLDGSNATALFYQMKDVHWDKKYLDSRRKDVLNKIARYNVGFDDKSEEADYENGKGTVVAYKDVPLLNNLKNNLPKYMGEKARGLVCGGNYYYDKSKCGIGYHGDVGKKRIVGVRLGATVPLYYRWFYDSIPRGRTLELDLNHGDMYVMSEKATGWDWGTKPKYTLRHAAGVFKVSRKPKRRVAGIFNTRKRKR